jgi:hypothetical protein
MTPQRQQTGIPDPSVPPGRGFPWLDLLFLLLLLGLPHALDTQTQRFWTALGSLAVWLWMRWPGWRGLLDFYGTVVLLLQLLVLGILLLVD